MAGSRFMENAPILVAEARLCEMISALLCKTVTERSKSKAIIR